MNKRPSADASAWIDDLSARVLPALLDSLAAEAWPLPGPGDRLGTYRLLSVLGEGGMGIVFRAHDERLQRHVAIKFLLQPAPADAAARQRLLAEARAAARLDHPAIASVHEVVEPRSGAPFIVMAYCDGEPLSARLERGPLPVDEAITLGRHVADALAAAHRAGIVHRDVKPSNIILTGGREDADNAPRQANRRIRLVDFGLAGPSGDGATVARRRMGTLPYMSPEQIEGGVVDARSDVWALGAVLHEALAGERPFGGAHPDELVHAILEAQPASLSHLRPEVPDALSAVVRRCLSRHARDRFASGEEVCAALTALLPDWPAPAPARDAGDDAHSAAAHCRRGRLLLDGGDPVSVARARDAFLAALDAKPDAALAWCGLSDAYEQMAYLAMLAPDEAHLRARAAADRALEIEPDLAQAHVSLATVLVDYYRDWAGAARHYRRALELDPGYATGHQLYAEFLRDCGEFDRALAAIDEAIRLDPIATYFRLVRGIILHMARRQEASLDAFDRVLQATPDYRMAHFYRSMPLAALGRFDEALEALAIADPEETFPDTVSLRGAMYAILGRRRDAETMLACLRAMPADRHVLPFHEATIRLSLGEVDRAIALLEEDAGQRSWFSRLLGVAPGLDPIRAHPRFQALLASVRRGPDA